MVTHFRLFSNRASCAGSFAALLAVGLLATTQPVAAQVPCPNLVTTVTSATSPRTLCPGGSLTLTAEATYRSFDLAGSGLGGGGTVNAIARQADGKILLGGSFDSFDGDIGAPNNILRLNADGTLDRTFNYSASNNTNGIQIGSAVDAIAVQPDGKILIGGDNGGFTTYNGQPSPSYIKRLNADGSLDTTFNPGGSGSNGHVYAILLQPDGKILVGGNSTAYNGNSWAPDGLMRLNTNGTLDQTFNYGINNGVDGLVRSIALQPDGKIVFGSMNSITQTGGTMYNRDPAAPNGVMRVNPDGSLDQTFNYFAGSSTAGIDGYVYAVVVKPNGKIVVGGTFYNYNGDIGAPNQIMQLNADGSLDTSFNYAAGSNSNGANYGVFALALQPDGKILATGSFTRWDSPGINAEGAPNGLMRLNADGSLDQTFNYVATGQVLSNGISGGYALVLQPDGRILVSNSTSYYYGTNPRVVVPQGFIRLNPDYTLGVRGDVVPGATYAWSNGSTGPSLTVTQPGIYVASATSGGCTAYAAPVVVSAAPVVAVAVTPASPVAIPAGSTATLTAAALTPGFNAGGAGFNASGQVQAVVIQPDGKVLAGGQFTTYNGVDVPDHLVRFNPDGTRDMSFNATGIGFAAGQGAGIVYALALQPDGKILVGGQFSTYNGMPVPASIVRINSDGSLDASFNGSGQGFGSPNSDFVYALALQPDGKVLVGGNFSGQYNGASGPGRLIRLNANGSRDASFNGSNSGFGSYVKALALQPDGKVLVGGSLTTYNGGAVPHNLVRLGADGVLDTSFNPGGAGFNGSEVTALLVLPTSRIVVGGNFTAFNNDFNVPDGLIRLTRDGVRDTNFNGTNAGIDAAAQVFGLALQPDGKIMAVGSFSTYNGTPAPVGLLRLEEYGGRDNTFNPNLGVGLNGFNSNALALGLQADGKVVIGGTFTAFNGQATAPDKLLRVNANGTLDNAATALPGTTFSWTPIGGGATLTVNAAGTYTATATTAGGCTYTAAPVVVTVTPTPAISSIAAPAGGTYGPLATAPAFRTIDITLTGNQALTVTGTPYLTLTVGTQPRQASYLSGSGTNALVFRYSVAAGDLDTDGITLGTLNTGSGSIRNSAGTNAVLTLPAPPSLAAVLVDGVAPVATASTRLTPSAAAPTNATTVSYQVVFGEAVTGVDAADFALTATGTAAGTVSTVSGSGSTYTVTAAVSGNGTLRLDLRATGTGITDLVNNPISTGYTAGQVFTLDHQAPVTTRFSQPTNPTVSSTASFSFGAIDALVGGVNSGVARYEASLDGAPFATVSSPLTYTALAPGSHTFAVRAVDGAGNVEAPALSYTWLIQPTATASAAEAEQVVVYPNPMKAGDVVTLSLPLTVGPVSFEVLNTLGQVVQPAQALVATGSSARAILSTPGLAAGVYVLRLRTATALISKRLVVE